MRSNDQQQQNASANEPSPYVGRSSCGRHGGNCGRHREEPATSPTPAPVTPDKIDKKQKTKKD
jgi:hypothetical protein